jgi:hypothetical protein
MPICMRFWTVRLKIFATPRENFCRNLKSTEKQENVSRSSLSNQSFLSPSQKWRGGLLEAHLIGVQRSRVRIQPLPSPGQTLTAASRAVTWNSSAPWNFEGQQINKKNLKFLNTTFTAKNTFSLSQTGPVLQTA